MRKVIKIKNKSIVLFEDVPVRREWIKTEEKWYFVIVDIIAVLTQSSSPGSYWRKLKERLIKEGNETVTNCHTLKMEAKDGKNREIALLKSSKNPLNRRVFGVSATSFKADRV